jgi:hypothetical protein
LLYTKGMAGDKSKTHRAIKRTLCILAGIILILVGRFWYISTHPLSNPRHGFQYYEPKRLPAGFHITDKRIDIVNPGGKLYGIGVDLNFRTEDWVYSIRESRANSSSSPDNSSVFTELNNYDPTSVSVTCRQENSAKKQSYRLCHWIDYGRISVYEVKFIKGGTYIDTRFPGTITEVVSISSINDYVDSFVKAKTTGFKTISGI